MGSSIIQLVRGKGVKDRISMFQVISNSFPADFCAMEHGPFSSMI
jgi:hypothetical protein